MAKQIISTISHTYEINKSKFICVLCAFHDFDNVMSKLKEEHPKGRHFVYAYRHFNEFGQVVENQSDDGEPKGSSGPPSLAVLRGEELVETAAIIVRYFGGIKLGVGGLIRAYGKSAHLSIEKAYQENVLKDYLKQQTIEYTIAINLLGRIDHFLAQNNILSVKKEFLGEEVNYKILTTEAYHKKISHFLDILQF